MLVHRSPADADRSLIIKRLRGQAAFGHHVRQRDKVRGKIKNKSKEPTFLISSVLIAHVPVYHIAPSSILRRNYKCSMSSVQEKYRGQIQIFAELSLRR